MRIVAFACIIAALNGCSRRIEPPEVVVGPRDSAAHVGKYALSRGLAPGYREIVREKGRWLALWEQLHGENVHLVPGPPTIDFQREQLLIVGMGTFPTGGFEIRIDSVKGTEHQLVAYVRSVYDCDPTQVVTGPVDIVRIPRRFPAPQFVDTVVGDPRCIEYSR